VIPRSLSGTTGGGPRNQAHNTIMKHKTKNLTEQISAEADSPARTILNISRTLCDLQCDREKFSKLEKKACKLIDDTLGKLRDDLVSMVSKDCHPHWSRWISSDMCGIEGEFEITTWNEGDYYSHIEADLKKMIKEESENI